MLPIAHPLDFAPFFGTPATEMLGRLYLAHADVTQRLQYLACRLSLGIADGCLRKYVSGLDEAFHAEDRAGPQERLALLLEAGAEGWVSILLGYIEEFSQAQRHCVHASFRMISREPPMPGLPCAAGGPGRVQRSGMTSGEMPIVTAGRLG